MGTHPIFESDFDCLTDGFRIFLSIDYPYIFFKMVKGDRQAWKQAYFEKARGMLTKYEKVFVCDAENVTSKQFQDIRTGIRGHGDVLMGKKHYDEEGHQGLHRNEPCLGEDVATDQ